MQMLLTLRFDGTAYHGFQVQKNALSVCEALQDGMQALYGTCLLYTSDAADD